ncbi:glycogen synthase GlgA [Bacillus sp. HMF5848]|uniref:glycogen synthase GlgA n=1 Tax=Bacillus sp. HMF5848 TaxID=2495421 RepID=UPI000F76C99A|nr:glycogen synthase GlgA [Bacillus sp. HMF5848]RSK28289.1 glycogen synthase GlgA [Bacillus sp. HMF5848]
MKVLFAVSECVPFIKSGGLADVAGALPKALVKQDVDVRVILPKYGMIAESYKRDMTKITDIVVPVGWRQQYCGIEMFTYNDVTYYFIDNEYYFKRDSLYGHYDDGERFSFFNRAILDVLPVIDFQPDVIHCHDWHTGMVPFLIKHEYSKDPFYKDIKTVFTIHNLQFQGIFPREALGDLLGLDDRYFNTDQLEFYGNINFMKGAIVGSDMITTVSPTYCQEIQTDYFGEKLDGLLRYKHDRVAGILNGIDEEEYNPETDLHIANHFSVHNIAGKLENKLALQRRFHLPERADVPVIAMVTRLTSQKGLDLVKRVLDEILQADDVQFVVLGTGDWHFEQYFVHMAYHYPEKCKAHIGFSEEMARNIYAGSDMFLMPSKFEPCGLSQLIAMRYGSIPIVRETGGLNDTVQSYNETTNEGNGFSFTNFNAHDMLHTIRRAIHFYQQKDAWSTIQQEAMSKDYSWKQSASAYISLYESV